MSHYIMLCKYRKRTLFFFFVFFFFFGGGGVRFYSVAPVARRAAKRSPIRIWETKGNPWVDFLMVIMASGIARGRVGRSRNMVAILQIMGWQRHAALVYTVYFLDVGHQCYDQLTPVKKVSADQYHVTISRAQVYSSSRSSIFWSWPMTKCWFFFWIAGSCLGNLLKTEEDCSEAG